MSLLATIVGLHHVQITVPPAMMAAAERFYGEALNLPRLDKPATLADRGGTWFEMGVTQLHLGIEDGVNRRATKAHVAYEVEDLEAWRQRMIDHEVSPIESVAIPGYSRFEARDPFGNRIEFIQRLG